MPECVLAGCQPEPLGSYLKALGILRIIAAQCDGAAQGRWSPDGFVIHSTLDPEAMTRFFCDAYFPSSIANPWNGAGGFYRRADKKTGARTKSTSATNALARVAESGTARLERLRAAIETARAAVARFGFQEAPKGDDKVRLVNHLRDELADDGVEWLDAVLVVGVEALGFPPVLGTGGTEGNFDLASNFYQRLEQLFDFDTGASTAPSPALFRAAAFAAPVDGLTKAAIGQFDPFGAGGGNAAPGFEGASFVNPWDFVLLLEGTMLLASATTKKLESAAPGSLTYPFSVRAVGADYASADGADEESSRHELWLPLWDAPTGGAELARLFGEGRADIGRKRSVHALDFARAIGTLGVDRGIQEFTRYAFHQRNGKSYFATPLGRWAVQRNPDLELIDGRLARWIDDLRRAARGKNAPASWGRASKAVERALFDLARSGAQHTIQTLMRVLAEAEAALGRTESGRSALGPVPRLDARWLERADDGSVESELAISLACTPIRERLTAARWSRGSVRWKAHEDHRTVWGAVPLIAGLTATVRRAEIERSISSEPRSHQPTWPTMGPSPQSIAAFVDARIDDARLAELTRAYSLVPPSTVPRPVRSAGSGVLPAVYSVCALVHHRSVPGLPQPLHESAGMVSALGSGDLLRGTTIATRRLRSAGVKLCVGPAAGTPRAAHRVAAALAFPLDLGLARRAVHAVTLAPDPDVRRRGVPVHALHQPEPEEAR